MKHINQESKTAKPQKTKTKSKKPSLYRHSRVWLKYLPSQHKPAHRQIKTYLPPADAR